MRFISRHKGATLSIVFALPLAACVNSAALASSSTSSSSDPTAAATAPNATGVTMSGPTTVNLGPPVAYGAAIAGTSNQLATWSISPATG